MNIHTCPVALVKEALAKRFFGSFANWACNIANFQKLEAHESKGYPNLNLLYNLLHSFISTQ